MVDCPVLVSGGGWEVIALLVSFEYSAAGAPVPHLLATCGCLSDVSLDSSVMGPL